MDTDKPPEHVGCKVSGKWYVKQECREFSTDGTAMGAVVAHMYGTMDNEIIDLIQEAEMRAEKLANLTGMKEEQADWEADDEHEYSCY